MGGVPAEQRVIVANDQHLVPCLGGQQGAQRRRPLASPNVEHLHRVPARGPNLGDHTAAGLRRSAPRDMYRCGTAVPCRPRMHTVGDEHVEAPRMAYADSDKHNCGRDIARTVRGRGADCTLPYGSLRSRDAKATL